MATGYASLVADRKSALMQMNKEIRDLRELLYDVWTDPEVRTKRPILWRRTKAYLEKTERKGDL